MGTKKDDFFKELETTSKAERKLFIFAYAIIIITSLVVSLFVLFHYDTRYEYYTNKEELKTKLQKVIRNGGDLELVKHIYKERPRKQLGLDYIFKKEEFEAENYPHDISLNVVLRDLFVDYYQNRDIEFDTLLYMGLTLILDEYEKKNPFDNLEENQRYSFENIQEKLGLDYAYIQSDIIKIVDELKHKNDLTNKYLNLSETSLNLSIVAFITTIVLSIWQILQGHYSNKRMKKFYENMKNDKDLKQEISTF